MLAVLVQALTPSVLMPTSTIPFEVLFEFTNYTLDAATLQLMRGDDGFSSGGGMILLHGRESVSLVLNAGSTYRYTVKQKARKAQISWVLSAVRFRMQLIVSTFLRRVRTWQDIQCNTSSVFSGHCTHGRPPLAGLTVTDLIRDS